MALQEKVRELEARLEKLKSVESEEMQVQKALLPILETLNHPGDQIIVKDK